MQEIEQLFRLYQKEVYGYLLSLTHSPQAAEDLLSETFLQALQGLRRFRGQSSAKTWLFGIARNLWLKSLRGKRETVEFDDLLGLYLSDDCVTVALDGKELAAAVGRLLAEKEPRTRRLMRLRAQGISLAEAAATLLMSENSARVLEFRTRRWLREELSREGLL